MGLPVLATDGDGKFLRPSDELMLQFFERYDHDGSGSMNSLSELRQLTTNLIVKLGLRIRPDEITRLVEQQDEHIDWNMGDFKAWFFEVLGFSSLTEEEFAEQTAAEGEMTGLEADTELCEDNDLSCHHVEVREEKLPEDPTDLPPSLRYVDHQSLQLDDKLGECQRQNQNELSEVVHGHADVTQKSEDVVELSNGVVDLDKAAVIGLSDLKQIDAEDPKPEVIKDPPLQSATEKHMMFDPVGLWELCTAQNAPPELDFSIEVVPIIGGVGKEGVGRCFQVEVHWTDTIPCCCCACKLSSGSHTGIFRNLVPCSFQHVGPSSFEFLDHSEEWEPEDLVMPNNNQLLIAYSTEEVSLLGNGSGRYILDLQRT